MADIIKRCIVCRCTDGVTVYLCPRHALADELMEIYMSEEIYMSNNNYKKDKLEIHALGGCKVCNGSGIYTQDDYNSFDNTWQTRTIPCLCLQRGTKKPGIIYCRSKKRTMGIVESDYWRKNILPFGWQIICYAE